MLHLVKKIYDLLFAYLQGALQRKLTLLRAKGNQGRESSNFQRLASFREGPCVRDLSSWSNTALNRVYLFLLSLFNVEPGQVKLVLLDRFNRTNN